MEKIGQPVRIFEIDADTAANKETYEDRGLIENAYEAVWMDDHLEKFEQRESLQCWIIIEGGKDDDNISKT